ncbi:MAG: hypothetical protein FJX89_08170 [Bacteroidetes bacterium]|nr:hypothetical protein [Bacteroidota bacterium]
MKRMRLLLYFLAILASTVQAQEPADALRYSWLTMSGTARNQALGGANVALGGDLSSLFINPAGIGLYKTGEFVLSPAYGFGKQKAGYLGNNTSQNSSSFRLGGTGLILPMNGSGRTKNVTFGVGINRVADFNQSLYVKGRNTQSSYSEKYLEELINKNVRDPNRAANAFPYGASLAFNTYLIDTVMGPGGIVKGYRSLATPRTGVNQEQTLQTSGGITEFSLGLSGNVGDKIFFGGSVNWNTLQYERKSIYREADATTNTRNNFNYFTVEDYLSTAGTGINLKLGVIVRPVESLRLGLAIHTPTLFNLKDSYASTVTTDLEGYFGTGTKTQSSRDFNNDMDGEFTYNFSNPLRLMAGLAYIFREDADVAKQRGFISVDLEYLNYGGASFSSADPAVDLGSYLNDLNKAVSGSFGSVINARVGGELKFETLMLRAGVAYYGNPYEGNALSGNRMNLSGGFGYRDKGRFIDVTYVHQIGKDGYYPYQLDNGFFAPVDLRSGLGTLLLTIGFKF